MGIDDSKVLDSVKRGMSLRDMGKDQKEDVKKVPADKQTSKDTKRNKEDKVKNPTPKKGKQKERPHGSWFEAYSEYMKTTSRVSTRMIGPCASIASSNRLIILPPAPTPSSPH